MEDCLPTSLSRLSRNDNGCWVKREVVMNSTFYIHLSSFLLIPAFVTGMLGLGAALFKYLEHRWQVKPIDLLVWVAILSRVGLGIVYLIPMQGVIIDDHLMAIQFFLTFLLLVEVLRGLRKIVRYRRSHETLEYLIHLGRPDEY